MTPMTESGSLHPALRNLKEVIPLSGFSEATVALVRDGQHSFVRKASNYLGGNERLMDQARRQRSLSAVVAGCAGVPAILNDGIVNGFYYFDMEFVPSRDAVNYLSHCSFGDVAEFGDRVVRLIRQLSLSKPTEESPRTPTKKLVLDKLDGIAKQTDGRFAAGLAALSEAVACLDKLVENDAPTAVHGDLTFENILVGRDGELWLIDTIPSPVDHYWIDWSKLFQECEGRWHGHRGRPLAKGVTWWLRSHLYAAATRMDSGYPMRHYILLGLTFARILPYAKNDEDCAFVGQRVANCGKAALEMFK